MSAKYQRLKQYDLLLPAPLRWLTRAFSSISLAVVLLALVAVYGVVASMPIAMLARGLLLALATLGCTLAAALLGSLVVRSGRGPAALRWAIALVLVLAGVALAVFCWQGMLTWTAAHPWFIRHRATIIYRLPAFEMTELEFYAWWPMKLILGLFVVNLVWATIRRIEFRFMNLGVLMVHSGIVLIALASIFYAAAKIEGDTILWRKDLGGGPVAEFYDQTTPAIYFFNALDQPVLSLSLADLPRYNDYLSGRPRSLKIHLHENERFRQVFGPHVRASINEFVAYGDLAPTWVAATDADRPAPDQANPALRLRLGDATHAQSGAELVLVSGVPALRAVELNSWALELLYRPAAARLADLTAAFDGPHGLVVEIPSLGVREVHAIAPGQTLRLADADCELTIEDIGPYGMSFVTPGYQGATDTRAMVVVRWGGKTFRRMVMHRYPERSQDFAPATAGDTTSGPMGRRTDPDPAIRLAYIDAGKPQYRLIARQADLSDLTLLARLPGQAPVMGQLPEDRFPMGTASGREMWLHVAQRMAHAVESHEPRITSAHQRVPKEEGTYLHALLPVDLEADVAAADGSTTTWHRRVWLSHMRYPMYPDPEHRPETVEIPGVGTAKIAFSRLGMPLPFALELEAFEMQPYAGTRIPRDFVADLVIHELDESSRRIVSSRRTQAHMNNPVMHRGIKLSQTGWDPGDENSPAHAARDAQGRFINQQRYTILGVGNNVGIRAIFLGGCLIALGIPWAFYVKPLLLRRQKRSIQRQLALQGDVESRDDGGQLVGAGVKINDPGVEVHH